MRILINLLREVPKWDRPSQLALTIATILLIIDLVILSTQDNLQTPALIGAVGLILAIQAIFMWGNRNLVTPVTQAQRQMLAGNFQGAVNTLTEYINTEEHHDLDALVLLGNAYRNLGNLEDSEKYLLQALDRRVDNHFALYGLAKTALAKGDYPFAIDHFKEALANDGHKTIHFDLALAYFKVGDPRRTVNHLQQLPTLDEPYRNLFVAYMQSEIGQSHDELHQYADGLVFWQAEADRFKHTPYGQSIAQDVNQLEKML
ncbi:MAG: tetratricopeptide repeat protein [Chloroflexota bacterium]